MGKLIERTNEVYHDLTGKDYDKEIGDNLIIDDKKRWDNIRPFFKKDKPLLILDIGTGTGFVPLMMADVLKKQDTFICSDVSQGILDIAKEKLTKLDFKCKFEFVKTKGDLPFETQSIDIIVINATLHHILDFKPFLKGADRILKPGGLLMICHEPNKRFRKSFKLQIRYNLLDLFFNTRDFIRVHSEKLKIDRLIEKAFALASSSYKQEIEKRNQIAEKINKVLIKENLISKPLTYKKFLMNFIDLQVKGGFDPFNLLSDYKIVYFKTFNHLRGMPRLNPRFKFLEKYEEKLIENYPIDGDLFTIILQKPQ